MLNAVLTANAVRNSDFNKCGLGIKPLAKQEEERHLELLEEIQKLQTRIESVETVVTDRGFEVSNRIESLRDK